MNRRRGLLWGLITLVALGGVSHAQELGREDLGADGVPINQDYFTASLYPRTAELLIVVETHHYAEPQFRSLRAGRYRSVADDMQYTLRKFPNHPKALMLLSSVARLMGDPEMAFSYFEHALSIYPQYAVTHAQYGHHLMESGVPNGAVKHLLKATELDSGMAQAHEWLAQAYERAGEFDLARQSEQRAQQLRAGNAVPEKASTDR